MSQKKLRPNRTPKQKIDLWKIGMVVAILGGIIGFIIWILYAFEYYTG